MLIWVIMRDRIIQVERPHLEGGCESGACRRAGRAGAWEQVRPRAGQTARYLRVLGGGKHWAHIGLVPHWAGRQPPPLGGQDPTHLSHHLGVLGTLAEGASSQGPASSRHAEGVRPGLQGWLCPGSVQGPCV